MQWVRDHSGRLQLPRATSGERSVIRVAVVVLVVFIALMFFFGDVSCVRRAEAQTTGGVSPMMTHRVQERTAKALERIAAVLERIERKMK